MSYESKIMNIQQSGQKQKHVYLTPASDNHGSSVFQLHNRGCFEKGTLSFRVNGAQYQIPIVNTTKTVNSKRTVFISQSGTIYIFNGIPPTYMCKQ